MAAFDPFLPLARLDSRQVWEGGAWIDHVRLLVAPHDDFHVNMIRLHDRLVVYGTIGRAFLKHSSG